MEKKEGKKPNEKVNVQASPQSFGSKKLVLTAVMQHGEKDKEGRVQNQGNNARDKRGGGSSEGEIRKATLMRGPGLGVTLQL